jgi:hypothetical protein
MFRPRLVHIIDDKLRINFSRCLDLVSNAIGNTSGSSSSAANASTGLQEPETDRESGNRDGRIIMILDGLETLETAIMTQESILNSPLIGSHGMFINCYNYS